MNYWRKIGAGIVNYRWNCKSCGVEYGEPDRRGYRQGWCNSCAARNKEEGAQAIGKVMRAVLRGELTRAKEHVCVDCGKQAHDWDHRDYTKPLEVVPVCRSCNLKRGRAFDSAYRPQSATV